MNKMKKLCGVLFALLVVMNSSVQPVFAEEKNFEKQIEEYVFCELSEFVEEQGIEVSIEGISCEIDYDKFGSQEKISELIDEKIVYIKTELSEIETGMNKIDGFARGISNSGDYYTAKVESMVPAIGWGYVCQDFSASVSSGKINRITLLGTSYDTGVTLGSWEPNRSWYAISNDKTYCQIYMKGTVNYLWEGLNLSMDATFEATGKANGNVIESAYCGDWPD